MLRIEDVPQADDVRKIILTIQAVENGSRTYTDIAEAIGHLTERQGRYYRKAAEILGFIKNKNNYSELTRQGQTFVDAGCPERMLKDAMLATPVINRLLSFRQSLGRLMNKDDIEVFLFNAIGRDEESNTDNRRSQTLIEWLNFIEK